MFNKVFSIVVFSFIAITFLSFKNTERIQKNDAIAFEKATPVSQSATTAKVKWYTWEEAVKASEKEKRKIFVDVYTDWCGWCKRMDKNTFSHNSISKYLNEDFYAVKLNAEQKADIQFRGHTFKFVKQGRRGYHQLAYELLNGRMSYPTVVVLNEEFARILIAPGYQEAKDFKYILQYAVVEAYKTKTWQKFLTEAQAEDAKKEAEAKKEVGKKKEEDKIEAKKDASAKGK